jgi:hypothetical protein
VLPHRAELEERQNEHQCAANYPSSPPKRQVCLAKPLIAARNCFAHYAGRDGIFP